jgi:hypothetical protein
MTGRRKPQRDAYARTSRVRGVDATTLKNIVLVEYLPVFHTSRWLFIYGVASPSWALCCLEVVWYLSPCSILITCIIVLLSFSSGNIFSLHCLLSGLGRGEKIHRMHEGEKSSMSRASKANDLKRISLASKICRVRGMRVILCEDI